MDNKYWTHDRLNRNYDQWPKERITNLKARISRSKWRLGYHIQPRTGLLNDPNGFSYYYHCWHLFYQTFPFGAVHGLKSWTHLVSADLINWHDVGKPMVPDGANDRNGCWSGSAMPIGNRLFIMYTGNVWNSNHERRPKQNGAWMDADGNIDKITSPLIDHSPQGFTGEFRDPQIIEHAGWYYAILGAQTDKREGRILVYRSKDVNHVWKFFKILDVGNLNLGDMVECPNLVFIHHHPVVIFCPRNMDHQRLKYSGHYPNVYIAGDSLNWSQMKIVNPTKMRIIDNGFDFYATQALNAPDGRTLAVSWVGYPGAEYPSDVEGWSGTLSLVRELDLRNGELIQSPVSETQRLFAQSLRAVNGMSIPRQAYVSWRPIPEKSSQIAITAETSHLYFETNSMVNRLVIHRQNDQGGDETRTVDLNLHRIKTCQLYFDNSEFELYINDGIKTATGRFFRDGSTLNLNWTDCGKVVVERLKDVNE